MEPCKSSVCPGMYILQPRKIPSLTRKDIQRNEKTILYTWCLLISMNPAFSWAMDVLHFQPPKRKRLAVHRFWTDAQCPRALSYPKKVNNSITLKIVIGLVSPSTPQACSAGACSTPLIFFQNITQSCRMVMLLSLKALPTSTTATRASFFAIFLTLVVCRSIASCIPNRSGRRVFLRRRGTWFPARVLRDIGICLHVFMLMLMVVHSVGVLDDMNVVVDDLRRGRETSQRDWTTLRIESYIALVVEFVAVLFVALFAERYGHVRPFYFRSA